MVSYHNMPFVTIRLIFIDYHQLNQHDRYWLNLTSNDKYLYFCLLLYQNFYIQILSQSIYADLNLLISIIVLHGEVKWNHKRSDSRQEAKHDSHVCSNLEVYQIKIIHSLSKTKENKKIKELVIVNLTFS